MPTRPTPPMPPNEPIRIVVDGKERVFDIDDPKLPDWVQDKAMSAGGYPYDKKMDKKDYEETLENLQVELVKLQYWLQSTGKRVMILFEGRDAAGKGGTIFVVRQYMNPRSARNVALTKPTETERGQWYFQRYVAQFPTAGEFVTFDRSWYNRAGVEPVMGFCTPEQHRLFLEETPKFEQMIVDEGIHFFKFWLNIGQETQLERFHDRRHDPLKVWKFSPIDLAGMTKWDDYTRARDRMMKHTHTDHAPWTVLRANDKRRSRLAAIRRILTTLPYAGRDDSVIGKEDDRIVCSGADVAGK
ncbi:polyphosphate kinase 2 [Aquibium sp. ELW1220]|jgi:polyphosphate kinase 2|uniref:polyphosphate kinase 2 n=1 Tax=Aquibium sp. ELW1220 TaxID=2976766 RepID=UPI0025AF19F6|nr:polyphosphate kinase 2 [Aquibium sp. ELW1220]MDN2581741.1 polyphosphate kinase 2 [Aquibium sp. ELW1220]